MRVPALQIDVHVDGDELLRTMKEDIRAGLQATPKEIPPKYFYDERGSELFERITELPEYYQTRTEKLVLERIARPIVRRHGFDELLELGSGSSTKTRVFLDAMREAGTLRRYIPFDVSESMMRKTADELIHEYPETEIHGVVGDFTAHLGEVPSSAHRLILFLGGTIGNLPPADAVRFLAEVAATMTPTDRFLLGTDLVKDPAILEAAYNDSAGVTAEFNLNVLRVINRGLDADFVPSLFTHVSFFNEEESRIEMWLRSSRRQKIRLRVLEMGVTLEAGEEIRTEISCKYTRESVMTMLRQAELELESWYTDSANAFGLALAALR
jgi:L-histidine N-alpha-methyltransferase